MTKCSIFIASLILLGFTRDKINPTRYTLKNISIAFYPQGIAIYDMHPITYQEFSSTNTLFYDKALTIVNNLLNNESKKLNS